MEPLKNRFLLCEGGCSIALRAQIELGNEICINKLTFGSSLLDNPWV